MIDTDNLYHPISGLTSLYFPLRTHKESETDSEFEKVASMEES